MFERYNEYILIMELKNEIRLILVFLNCLIFVINSLEDFLFECFVILIFKVYLYFFINIKYLKIS